MTEFNEALAEAPELLAEQLAGLPNDPAAIPDAIRKISERLADRAGLEVMERIRAAGRDAAAGGSGEL